MLARKGIFAKPSISQPCVARESEALRLCKRFTANIIPQLADIFNGFQNLIEFFKFLGT